MDPWAECVQGDLFRAVTALLFLPWEDITSCTLADKILPRSSPERYNRAPGPGAVGAVPAAWHRAVLAHSPSLQSRHPCCSLVWLQSSSALWLGSLRWSCPCLPGR